jgi:hypothetical protein
MSSIFSVWISQRLIFFKIGRVESLPKISQQLKWVPLRTGHLTRAKINRPVSSAVGDTPGLEISYLGCKAENTCSNKLAACGGSGRGRMTGQADWKRNRLWSCELSGWLWSTGSQWCSVHIAIHGWKWMELVPDKWSWFRFHHWRIWFFWLTMNQIPGTQAINRANKAIVASVDKAILLWTRLGC